MNNNTCIYFVKLPSLQHLCHVTLQVTSAKTDFHTQVVKCRQLLFVCRDLISAPQIANTSLIDAVVHVEFYKRKFGALCQKLELKPIHAAIARNFVLERCVLYTIKVRLAPQWNQVGSILVNKVDFLLCHGRMDAVNFEVTVRESEMTLKVKPYLIRLPPPALEGFGICPEALENFHDDPGYEIPESAINLEWCHILPTMNRGQIVRISHTMPCDSGSFLKNYDDLRKYWKNQYGYQLPDVQEDVIYCSIYFKQIISSNLFTYPLVCIRNKPVQFMPRCDGQVIVQNFITEVQRNFSRICGFSLTYAAKPCSATNTINNSSMIKKGTPQNVRIREVQDVSKVRRVPDCSTSLTPQKQTEQNQDIIPQTQHKKNISDVKPCMARRVPLGSSTTPSDRISLNFPTTSEGRFVPVFHKKNIIRTRINKIISNPSLKSAAKKQTPLVKNDFPVNKNKVGPSSLKQGSSVSKPANQKTQAKAKRLQTPPTSFRSHECNLIGQNNLVNDVSKTMQQGKSEKNTSNPSVLQRSSTEIFMATSDHANVSQHVRKANHPKHKFEQASADTRNSSLKKKHKFDQFFQSASASNAPDKAFPSTNKKHKFDEIFTPALTLK